MNNKFFEGEDFKNSEFKALTPEYYPDKYKRYIKEETNFLKSKLSKKDNVLEAGVGIGRLIPELAPLVFEFVGFDNANLMIQKSNEVAKKFSNVKIVKENLENLSKIFPKNHFSKSLCVWNTLGNVKNEIEILKEISKVTKGEIFVTIYLKGTLQDRKKWYDSVGIEISKIDENKEVFYSKSGLKSKSYSLEEIKSLAEKSGLVIKGSKILGEVILWVELERV